MTLWESVTMIEEFKKFALRGNVVDLAVGIVIGTAFGAIVASLVSDVFMPVIGALTGGLDFSNYYVALANKIQQGLPYLDAKKQGAVLGYGQFITVAINFIVIAFVLFLVVRGMNRLSRQQEQKIPVEAKEPEIPADVKLLAEIRDLLIRADPERAGVR
jgi:large conductance mechanosensitive channel